MQSVDYVKPALIGAYAAGGLYVARWLKGSSQDISMTALGSAAAIGAVSAFMAPPLSKSLVCPHSPAAPLIESAASAGVSWAAIWVLADMESANMFVPVQLGAHLLGFYVAPKISALMTPAPPPTEDNFKNDSMPW